MKRAIYGIYDEKLADIQEVFFRPNDAVAVREFADLVNDKDEKGKAKNPIAAHYEDYSLVRLGTCNTNESENQGMILQNSYQVLMEGKNAKIEA